MGCEDRLDLDIYIYVINQVCQPRFVVVVVKRFTCVGGEGINMAEWLFLVS